MSERKQKMLDNSEYLANEWLAESAFRTMLLEAKAKPIPTQPSLWEKIKRLFK